MCNPDQNSIRLEIRCDDCNGTGRDEKKTENARRCGRILESDGPVYIRCWNCLGNGIAPEKVFKWSD